MSCRRHRCHAILCILFPLWSSAAHAQPMRPPELPTPSPQQAGAEPGYLGMVADDRQENGRGVRVKDVDPDSPAAKAGLQTEDLITAINGQPIHSDDDLGNLLRPLQPGTKVTFQIDRQGKSQNVEATLTRRPPPEQRRYQNFGRLPEAPADQPGQTPAGQSSPQQLPAGQSSMPSQLSPSGGMPSPSIGPGFLPRPQLGVRTMPVTEQDRIRLGLPSVAGAHVIDRTPGSPAEKANVPADSVITAVNGTPVSSPSDLSALLARAGAGAEIELTYFYNGNSARTKATLGFSGASRDIGRAGSMAAGPTNPPTANAPSNWPPSVPFPTSTPPRQTSALPPQNRAQSSAADAQRIDALERRIQQLEQKVQDLESRQPHGA